MKRVFVAAVVSLLAVASAHAKKEPPAPAGTKVISGSFFDVYVVKQQETAAPANYVSRAFQVTFLAHTAKHGIQRITRRIETLDSDLLDKASWEIVDLDGDGSDDVRYLAQRTKAGCKMWPALRWEKDHDRFTQGGPQLARAVDANGKTVANCVLR